MSKQAQDRYSVVKRVKNRLSRAGANTKGQVGTLSYVDERPRGFHFHTSTSQPNPTGAGLLQLVELRQPRSL